jgi:hypothetical protein
MEQRRTSSRTTVRTVDGHGHLPIQIAMSSSWNTYVISSEEMRMNQEDCPFIDCGIYRDYGTSNSTSPEHILDMT